MNLQNWTETCEKKVRAYFITGTGRCGTKLFAKLFSLSNITVCEHEEVFRHESMLRFYMDSNQKYYIEDIKNALLPRIKSCVQKGKSYGVSSTFVCLAVPLLYSLFGESVRFVLLVRKPEEFVRSALARGFFDKKHPNACIQILPNPANEVFKIWNYITPFEKISGTGIQ